MAIAVGLGMTVEQAAESAGLQRATYYQRHEKNPDFYNKWKSYTESAAEKTLALRIGAAKAAQSAEDKIVSRLDDALKITDRIVKELTTDDNAGRCDECGRLSTDTLKDLIAGQKAITQWVGKFAASEAPKRLQVSGAVMHGHVALQDDTVAALAGLMQHMRAIPALATSIPEAEVVEQ